MSICDGIIACMHIYNMRCKTFLLLCTYVRHAETKSNQPPTKTASSKPAPKNDKVQSGGKGKK